MLDLADPKNRAELKAKLDFIIARLNDQVKTLEETKRKADSIVS